MADRKVYVAVIGAGGIGSAFISQLSALSKRYTSLTTVIIARSKTSLISDTYSALDLSSWKTALAKSQTASLTPDSLVKYLSAAPGPSILIDNTSDQTIADAYPSFLRKGISVVTPNKKAFSGPLSLFKDIFTSAHSLSNPSGGFIYHESACGAGLPTMSALHDLIATGDKVKKIEGVMSGTLSYLFSSFAPVTGSGGKWSAEVAKAKGLGLTEPDPREDLNGLDVARKCVILARLAGLEVEGPTAFPVQSLIPKELEGVQSGDEFMRKLHEYDGEMEKVKGDAERQGKVVRYVGSVDVENGKVSVAMELFDKSHPIATLKAGDNIFNFHTERYGDKPMIITGSGAGAELTAMGVTADLIRVLERLH